MMALADRVSMSVERAVFADLVTLVTQAPTWEKDRLQGIRVLLRAISEGKPDAPEQILARWTWKLARASRKAQDRRASAEFPEAKRLLGALANSRGHRHEENAAKLVNAARELPLPVGAALLVSAEGYTTRATQLIERARERLAPLEEVAGALADNLPAPKTNVRPRRRRRRRRGGQQQVVDAAANGAGGGDGSPEAGATDGQRPQEDGAAPARKRSRRRRRRATASVDGGPEDAAATAQEAIGETPA